MGFHNGSVPSHDLVIHYINPNSYYTTEVKIVTDNNASII